MIYLVTPVFNRKKFTKDYLISLKNQTNNNFKIIIVDDGSTDGTSNMIEKEFPEVILLKESGNLWWAEATNIGIRYAIRNGADYIMTLNDDTLPKSDYIEKMYFWIDKKPLALLGAFAIDVKTKEPVFGGEILDWKIDKYHSLLNKIPKNEYCGLKEVNTFPGRGFLIPTKVFKDIGFYDSKNFPQTVADLDFACRAYNKGYKLYCNYDAKIEIYPDESATVQLQKNRSLKNYYNHLFGIRGGGNIIWFTKFAFKNAPLKYLPTYLFIGLSKRIFSYPVKWLLGK